MCQTRVAVPWYRQTSVAAARRCDDGLRAASCHTCVHLHRALLARDDVLRQINGAERALQSAHIGTRAATRQVATDVRRRRRPPHRSSSAVNQAHGQRRGACDRITLPISSITRQRPSTDPSAATPRLARL